MLKILRTRLQQGTRTLAYPAGDPVLPDRFRGAPRLDASRCPDGCRACVEACPAEATIAGTRQELLAEAHRRIAESPESYHPHVYGETEVGGTSVLFLSPVPFESLGFASLGKEAPPNLTCAALQKVPAVVSMGGAALFAIWWITHRREEVAAAEAAPRLSAKEVPDAID